GSPARPFVQFHYSQALRLHGSFWGISLLSCGIGLLILAVPVLWMSLRAADAAGAGEWFRMPYVGGPPATLA
ncbi:MAG TPA: hypothetical protein PKW90_07675, partial [Myxococcota bacterium]|nr:hypothetical protein [Myxococcota bacterium]